VAHSRPQPRRALPPPRPAPPRQTYTYTIRSVTNSYAAAVLTGDAK
jgi:hypothetical protein